MTAQEFLNKVNATEGNWAETCCSLSWKQHAVMKEVQQAVTNGSISNPAYWLSPQAGLTIVNYFNEYSVAWEAPKNMSGKSLLAGVFMVGHDNPFAPFNPQLVNITRNMTQQWVLAWKNSTGVTLPVVQLSHTALEAREDPFSCAQDNNTGCQSLAIQLNNEFRNYSEIFISILFHSTEITTAGPREWSSLNRARIPATSTNRSRFNALWFMPNGAPQSGVIATEGIIGTQIQDDCVLPLDANTDEREKHWGNRCASPPQQ